MQRTGSLLCALISAACVQGGCGGAKDFRHGNDEPANGQGSDVAGNAGEPADGQGSDVAVSLVSGALNNTGGSVLGWNSPSPRAKPSTFERALELLNPVGVAWAAQWTCTGGTLSPAFAGPASYTYTPVSCSVTWKNGDTASSVWDGTFNLVYGPSCDDQHPFMRHQAAGCSLTRTTGPSGNTRTLTGRAGNSHSVTHNTNGAASGYDPAAASALTDDGVIVTCGAGGCDSDGTLVISGSHLTGTVTTVAGGTATRWDHTVSGMVALAATAAGPVVSGTVTVEHNLAQRTSTTAFNDVTYGDATCCFPTAGSVATTMQNGRRAGQTETLTFGSTCGEATLTTFSGGTVALTLESCL
jgi:hypothetical protein